MNKDAFKWAKENEEFITSLTEGYAEDFLQEVKKLTPVKTGRLRDGWKREKNIVTNDVPYLQYVDQGTRYIKPRRFIEAAFQRVISKDENRREN